MSITRIASASCAPDRLLTKLAEWLQADTDRELSRTLQISPQVIRALRAGRIAVSPSLLLLMAEAAGKRVDDLRELLGERRRRARTCGSIHGAAVADETRARSTGTRHGAN